MWVFSSHSRIAHSYGDVTFTGEGPQISNHTLPYGHWALRLFLACHTHCVSGHPFIMIISQDCDTTSFATIFIRSSTGGKYIELVGLTNWKLFLFARENVVSEFLWIGIKLEFHKPKPVLIVILICPWPARYVQIDIDWSIG